MADNDQITRKPDSKVQALTAPKRIDLPSHKVQTTWNITSWAHSNDNPAEALGFDAWMRVVNETGGKEGEAWVKREVGISARQMSVDLSSMAATNGTTYTRASYYPLTARYLKCLTAQVRLKNNKGVGEWQKATRWFQKPRKPIIAELYQDAETGKVKYTINTNAGEDYQERYDTRYQIWVYDSHAKTSTCTDSTSTSTSISGVVDIPNRMSLAYGEYVRVRVITWARGYRGDSDKVQKDIYVGWPYQPTITKVDITSTNTAAKVTALVKLSPTTEHPVTGCKLQKLVNVEYENAADIPGNALWVDTGAIDDGNCTALAVTVAELQPTAGLYTWIRVKSWNDIEETFYRYSVPIRVKKLETPAITAEDDRCAILKIIPDYNGTGATVIVGWNENTANTGTELSWSTEETAWASNVTPETATYTTEDATSQSSFWAHTATLTLSNLNSGTTYYIMARRYLTPQGGTTTYTAYSAMKSFRTESASGTTCGIVSATPTGDGTTIAVVVGWTSGITDKGELSWSDDYRAWYSTEQPQRFEFDWQDGTSQSSSWANTATVYISDLEGGTNYYLRARRYTSSSSTYSSYSKMASVMTNSDDEISVKCGIVSATPNADGQSVKVIVGWTESAPFDGTELSWSNKYTAWFSTNQPSIVNADWQDATRQSTRWKKTATITVEGLEPGTLYYFRARRYKGAFKTPYSAFEKAIPATTPTGVELSAPGVVVFGDGMPLSWTYDTSDLQTGWEIVTGTVSMASGAPRIVNSGMTVIANGFDSMTSFTLPYWRMRGVSTLPVAVRVSTGGEYVMSDAQIVKVGVKPTAAITSAELNDYGSGGAHSYAQPLKVSLSSDVAGQAIIVVRSNGVTDERPDGDYIQADGDVVWSRAVTPSWTLTSGTYYATVTAPSDLDLVDGATYTVEAKVRDINTGLTSDEAYSEVTIDYTVKAPEPPSTITVTPYDTNTDGIRRRGCQIQLASTGDSNWGYYDIYRVTDDGASLAISGCKRSDLVVDEYAPFGGAYRIATRTPSGSLNWRDYPNTLAGGILRIDFGDSYIEFPHNITIQDDYEKRFEEREHLDGSTDGYWNKGVRRIGALSISLTMTLDGTTMDRLRALARYEGACWVRTPDGCAYAANVDVTGLDRSIGDGLFAVSLKATEIDTDEFMATVPADVEDDS